MLDKKCVLEICSVGPTELKLLVFGLYPRVMQMLQTITLYNLWSHN